MRASPREPGRLVARSEKPRQAQRSIGLEHLAEEQGGAVAGGVVSGLAVGLGRVQQVASAAFGLGNEMGALLARENEPEPLDLFAQGGRQSGPHRASRLY